VQTGDAGKARRLMAEPSCPECGGTRWARYFSETMDGNFEEAFKLCPCNHKPEMGSNQAREKPERPETAAGKLARACLDKYP
jgi:hypothetical protein